MKNSKLVSSLDSWRAQLGLTRLVSITSRAELARELLASSTSCVARFQSAGRIDAVHSHSPQAPSLWPMRTSARHITEQNPKPPQGLTAQALTHRHRPAWPPQARDQRLSVCESRFCWPFAHPRQRPSAHARTAAPPSAAPILLPPVSSRRAQETAVDRWIGRRRQAPTQIKRAHLCESSSLLPSVTSAALDFAESTPYAVIEPSPSRSTRCVAIRLRPNRRPALQIDPSPRRHPLVPAEERRHYALPVQVCAPTHLHVAMRKLA